MGKKDFRHREAKKPKRDVKKTSTTTILSSPTTVEVIRKSKKERKDREK